MASQQDNKDSANWISEESVKQDILCTALLLGDQGFVKERNCKKIFKFYVLQFYFYPFQ